jgi:predicted transposase YbfD/YdcC
LTAFSVGTIITGPSSLRGMIVTTGALNCQRAIASQVVEQGGEYVLALKVN